MYELIQNADDCSFADDGRLRQLLVECGSDALVAYHNETGFQPRDLYAMCQVSKSTTRAFRPHIPPWHAARTQRACGDAGHL